MQRAVMLDAVVDSLVHRLVIEEVAVFDSLGDARELLIHDAACAHVGVADLAVAHLTVRQTDVQAGRPDHGQGVFEEQLVKIRRARLVDGVAVLGRDAEAVHNNQSNRFFHKIILSV